MWRFAAVVLAGGAARRMGGRDKPALVMGGQPMVARVLAAVAHATPRVVVGPPRLASLLPDGALLTCEDPPGAGPVAATAAGLACLPDPSCLVAVLATDLPFLTADTVTSLREAALANTAPRERALRDTAESRPPSSGLLDGALLVDATGRPQWLCGVWRLESLRTRLVALGDPAGRGMRELLGGLRFACLGAGATAAEAPTVAPAWFDCDTEDDLRQAQEWVHGDAG